MSRFYLTAVAAAVMAASVNAAEFPSFPTEYTYTFVSQPGDKYWSNTTVATGESVFYTSSTSSDGSNALMHSNGGTDITLSNSGSIWTKAGGENGKYVSAITVDAGNTGINEQGGFIYIKSENSILNLDAAKAMTASASKTGTSSIVNKGNIFVERATGMLATDYSDDASASISNEGTITVINSGMGISLGKGNASGVSVSNSGTIYASGSNSFGITQSDATNGTVTNTGTVIATDGATAIASGRWSKDNEFKLNLEQGSHVEGDIALGNKSDVSIKDLDSEEELTFRGSVRDITVDNSTVVIKKSDKTSTLKISSIDVDSDASTTFEFDTVGTSEKKLVEVGSVTGEGTVNVNYTGDVSDALANNQASLDDLIDGVQLGDNNSGLDNVIVDEGKWGNGYVLDNTGNILSTTTNSLLSSTTDLALMNGLVWRSQLTNLSDRMGTLRTMPQAAGAWARYNNGRLDGRGIEYDYNTIEVGFDAPVSSNFLVGVSFDYTIGDTDLNAGSADNDVYTLGLYGTYFGDNGGFVDLMAKIGRIDNEYDISNKSGVENGDYMMTGAIVVIEAGHRFDLAHNTFIEPQVQLSYSWLRASDYSTNVRSVNFETIESLVARVGVMGGIKFNENRGAAYLKASYNHDFLGDVDAEYSALDGSMSHPFKISDELDDNWAEVSLGFSYNVTDSFNTFLDVGTGFGGDIDQKWRVNFGGRYTF